MSIDARVWAVGTRADGSGELLLEDRPRPDPAGSRDRPGGRYRGIAGQARLNFRSAPADVRSLAGREIWGDGGSIYLGDTRIARREGYTRIVFVVDSVAAVPRDGA